LPNSAPQGVDGGPTAAMTTEQLRRLCPYFNVNAACARHDDFATANLKTGWYNLTKSR
jgi:hypothetical protein